MASLALRADPAPDHQPLAVAPAPAQRSVRLRPTGRRSIIFEGALAIERTVEVSGLATLDLAVYSVDGGGHVAALRICPADEERSTILRVIEARDLAHLADSLAGFPIENDLAARGSEPGQGTATDAVLAALLVARLEVVEGARLYQRLIGEALHALDTNLN